jgi:hypothetical protein
MQTFKRVHTYRSINNFTFLQFSSFGQPQSKWLLLFFFVVANYASS